MYIKNNMENKIDTTNIVRRSTVIKGQQVILELHLTDEQAKLLATSYHFVSEISLRIIDEIIQDKIENI